MKKNALINFMVLMVTVLMLDTQKFANSANSSSETNSLNVDPVKQESIESIKSYAGKLQAELRKALKEGGAVNAISVCNTEAEQIGLEISQKRNLTIKRVSIKNRNPNNVPNNWQRKVLEEFESRKTSGEAVSELTYSDVAEIGAKRQYRFMKAIPTGTICIKCHGTKIAAEVSNKLDQLYPEDKARGFLPGDIRGAFVITKDL